MLRSLLLLSVSAVLAVLPAACSSAPAKLPEGEGRGVIAFDPTPPAGAEVFERPTLHVGDAFKLLRGGRKELAVKVVAATDQGYELEDQTGARMFRDLDLANLGESPKDSAQMVHQLSPRDVRFHWPLWVGKRWRCQYLDKTAAAAVPIEAAYEVEGLDTIAVPAGTFRCLRIRRTTRLDSPEAEAFYDRTTIIWYAPDVGLEVRQILGETAIDLVEWQPAKG